MPLVEFGARLILAVDSGPAHLAASLGIETWVLHRYDPVSAWRWTDPATWYPSARVFQQPEKPGNWGDVFRDVSRRLLLRPCQGAVIP
jgi:ADP-heptose:LPS heptosyltransferase